MRSSKTMDLTQGSVLKQMLLFALPIMLGNILQQLYNVADRVVVGQFAANGEVALAAVGATGSAIFLVLGLFNGMAVGVDVICANLLGARKGKELRESMHTGMLVAVLFGLGVGLFGVLSAKWMLQLLDTPGDVLEPATLYMQIYYLGAPASLIYNFGAAILRSHGDTKRPMYILMLSGIVNVVLNVVLVVVFKRSVDGVAIATVISQLVSAVMVLKILFDPENQYKLTVKELKINKKQLSSILKIGVTSGLGGMAFSLSNMIVQAAVNSFNSAIVIAGRTAASDINALVYQVQAALYATCVSFSGQCYGAKKHKRIDVLALLATVICTGAYLLCAIACTVFSRQFIGLFNSNPQVIAVGAEILMIINWGMLLYGPSEIFLGCLRGMKQALAPTLLNLLGICVPRLIWLWFVFPLNPTVPMLFWCYPISWITSSVLQGGYYFAFRKKMDRKALCEKK